MHELILLRHASATDATASQADLERALTEQGVAQARDAGRWLQQQGCQPALILHSPAQRTLETATLVREAVPAATMQADEGIYEASAGELIALVDAYSKIDSLLLVGHNPGLEQLLALLVSGRSGGGRGMPPAAAARIALDGRIEPGAGRLLAFWSP